MEPYEKLLSPLAKRRYRPTASRYSLRGLCPTDDTPTSSGGNIEETENKETEIKEEKEIQGEEQVEEEEEEEEEEEDEETGYYNLRKRRPVVYQYQPVIQVRVRGGREGGRAGDKQADRGTKTQRGMERERKERERVHDCITL